MWGLLAGILSGILLSSTLAQAQLKQMSPVLQTAPSLTDKITQCLGADNLAMIISQDGASGFAPQNDCISNFCGAVDTDTHCSEVWPVGIGGGEDVCKDRCNCYFVYGACVGY